jgi:molecular chaperone GrpE
MGVGRIMGEEQEKQDTIGSEERDEGEVEPSRLSEDQGLSAGGETISKIQEEPAIRELKERIASLEGEKKVLEDRYLRTYAEFENYRKRVTRDQSEFAKFANEKLLKELLVVVDNLERALLHSKGTTEWKGWVEGVELTFKQFSEILSKSGVMSFESVGLPFDPSRQQAMAQVETEEKDDNIVVEELQKGYLFHDRVLRPALVTVAKRKGMNPDQATSPA